MADTPLTRRELLAAAAAAAAAGSVSSCASYKPHSPQPDYSLQREISDLRVPTSATLIGVGRIGSWAAFFAALAGVKHLVLVDPAKVDTLDVATTPFQPSQIGWNKVDAIREVIRTVRPDVTTDCKVMYFDADRDEAMLQGVVLNGASDPELFQRLPEFATAKRLQYAGGFYNGLSVGVINSAPETLKIVSGAPVPVWVGSAAVSALFAVHAVMTQSFNYAGPLHNIDLPSDQLSVFLDDLISA